MAAFAALALAWAGLILLARIAWLDFRTLKIKNSNVAVLLGVTLLAWLVRSGGQDAWDLAAGGFLFVLGFVFWALRLMGGGDAKLFLPIGIMAGWDHLLVFGLALLPASILSLILLKSMARFLPETSGLATRANEIARRRGIPYGVPLFFAAFVALLPRLGLV